MKVHDLASMKNGWFVGDFEPTLLRTTDVEVAVKRYAAGDYEEEHHHRIATELSVIVSGEVEMCGRRLTPGQIVVLAPGEATDFRAVTDAVLTVVKFPGAKHDKYPGRAGPEPK